VIKVDVQLARQGFTLDVAFESDVPVMGVFGPSGAGKTTLINLLAGLERPDRGSIAINGRTLFDHAGGVNVPAHLRRVGVVFQEHRLFPHYSITGNLQYGSRGDGSKLQSIVDLLELEPLLQRRVDQLSGGERQRIGLGRALLSNPQVLLLDEPLASLDQRLRQQILPYLRRVREVLDVPVLYVSHDLPEILQLTDELVVLERGRVAGHGRYADLVHEAPVLAVVHDRGMTNMLRARVTERDPGDGVSVLSIGTTRIVAPIGPEAPGEEVIVSVQPWDVALAAQRVGDVSIQNQLPGVVTRCTTHDRRVLVEVDCGAPIVVEISRRSATAMKIEAGKPIVCLIKSHAIRYLGGRNDPCAADDVER
jgi:molybdate transport system ATP-binding protein